MHLGVAECRVSYFNLCTQISKNRVTSVNPILFDIGTEIWLVDASWCQGESVYSLGVTVTLISDHIKRVKFLSCISSSEVLVSELYVYTQF